MSARHHSHLSSAGLLRRQFFAAPVASILLALLVLAGALLATAVPRAVAAMHTAALGERLAEYPARELDVLNSSRASRASARRRAGRPSRRRRRSVGWARGAAVRHPRAHARPLAEVTGDPLTVLFTGPSGAQVAGAAAGSISYQLFTGFDPRLREHVTLTSGEWPAVLVGSARHLPTSMTESLFRRRPHRPMSRSRSCSPSPSPPRWHGSSARCAPFPSGGVAGVRLVGTFAAVDPDDGFWTHVPVALEPSVAFSPDGSLRITDSGSPTRIRGRRTCRPSRS